MKLRRVFIWPIFIFLLVGCSNLTDTPLPNNPTIFPTSTFYPTTEVPPTTPAPTVLPPLQLTKGPYLILTGNPAEMKVCWQLSSLAPATLEWGTDTSYSLGSIPVAVATTEDVSCATLTGLQPSTHYDYRITNNEAAATSDFVSLKSADDPNLTFWVYGDSRSGPEIRNSIDAAILASIAKNPANQTLLFSTGDLMDNASEESLQQNEFSPEYTASRQILSKLPVVNVMGNHDGTKLFIKYFPYPYTSAYDWSFDDGPAHFVVIDQYYGGDETSPRWQWLREDLANSTKKWKFILLHEPGWSAGPHENNLDVQKIIHPIAFKYGVEIVFAGHNHYYSRAEVDGVTYITTGGAGAPLYDPEHGFPNILVSAKENHYLKVQITGGQLILTAVTPDGNIIDELTVNR